MQSSTCAWFVRKVQWVVPSLDIYDRVILYSVSRFLLLVLLVTRSVSEISKPARSSCKAIRNDELRFGTRPVDHRLRDPERAGGPRHLRCLARRRARPLYGSK